MQSLNEKPQVCESCKKNEATEPYDYKGLHTLMVCITCLLRLKARDQLEDIVQQSIELDERGQFDEALACLDAFMDANRDYDHEQRFAREVADWRVTFLLDAGRYAEAERVCEAWAELGFLRVCDRWTHGSATAKTLDALGRSREGLAVLEEALSHQDPTYVPAALHYLETLAKISEKLGQPVDPKWRSLAEESAASYGVEIPAHEPLGKAILEAAEAIVKTDPSDDDDET